MLMNKIRTSSCELDVYYQNAGKVVAKRIAYAWINNEKGWQRRWCFWVEANNVCKHMPTKCLWINKWTVEEWFSPTLTIFLLFFYCTIAAIKYSLKKCFMFFREHGWIWRRIYVCEKPFKKLMLKKGYPKHLFHLLTIPTAE